MTNWEKEICSQQPLEIEQVSDDTLIQRKNITTVEHPEDGEKPSYTDYECESRFITTSEYNMLKSIEEINTEKAIDEYTMSLIESGVL